MKSRLDTISSPLLSLPPSPIESPIHDCERNLDQGPSCRCLPTRNSDIATQRFALFTQRAPFPPHHCWAYVCARTRAMQQPGACVPDANACAPAKARAGRKHRVDTRERARGLMDDRFCVEGSGEKEGEEGRGGSVAFA